MWNVNSKLTGKLGAFTGELIETLWNVNLGDGTIGKNINMELIETLWNVNTTGQRVGDVYNIELIETLWNVNSEYGGAGMNVAWN